MRTPEDDVRSGLGGVAPVACGFFVREEPRAILASGGVVENESACKILFHIHHLAQDCPFLIPLLSLFS